MVRLIVEIVIDEMYWTIHYKVDLFYHRQALNNANTYVYTHNVFLILNCTLLNRLFKFYQYIYQ